MAEQRTAHENKYDRQLRLWGFHGQRALEASHVCVLGAGPIAAEALKNLVLPNLAQFTVVDANNVSRSDLGNNFFVTEDSVGKPRAEVVKDTILELNATVKGNALIRNPSEIIANDLDFFKQFNMIIGTQLPLSEASVLGSFLYTNNIPFLNVKSNGLLGYARLLVPEHAVIESHPDNTRFDLFIYPEQLKHWPEYREYLFSFDLNVVDEEAHAHIPFVAILAQLSAEFMQAHNGNLPKGRNEVEEFKSSIVRRSKGGLNWEEALGSWYFSCKPPSDRLSPEAERVLKDPKSETSPDLFWVKVYALNKFVSKEGNGFLPVTTNLPDMTSFPKYYTDLKAIFEKRSKQELVIIKGYVSDRLVELGKPAEVDDADLAIFVKNCRNLALERFRAYEDELKADDSFKEAIGEFLNLMEEDEGDEAKKPSGGPLAVPHNIHWYIALRAAERFHEKFHRYPGQFAQHSEDDLQADVAKLTVCAEELLSSWDLDPVQTLVPQTLEEITRFGSSEVGVVGAAMGALSAQATLKIVTKQYVPFNNTVIFNFVNTTVDRFQF
eukprot:TRINITY_DN5020_c0_g1_i1.p1 TRINITY_DN5020_c0_g1~~TRINITY_DN5020_c0_g1_i1.p1  ORF type:complete len:552 (+),score=153.31 TRINITY_DN5020_c0_g1_i1:1610-3265(+)